MKKICFVTAARSEYGLLKWLMRDVAGSNKFQLQLIVTGGHLLKEQGYTLDQIFKDGFKPDKIVNAHLDVSSQATIAASMGRMAKLFASAFDELRPDYLLVLGDRYELLPVCSTAFVMRIPIIHLSGGDITEGAIDNGIRNAVTMLASYHFPGTIDSAKNIIRMRGSTKNVWPVGDPGLDDFFREKLLTRDELAAILSMNPEMQWGLMTFHAETTEGLDYNLTAVRNCLCALETLDRYQIVLTYSNTDFGGQQINGILKAAGSEKPERFKVVPSLGNLRYLSLMKQAKFVIGNSSSGIVEAPMAGLPAVNIGNRQKGRYQCSNVVQCNTDPEAIKSAIDMALNKTIMCGDSGYWGDGHTAERIMRILSEISS